MARIRVAVVGVGNCASSLIQGVEFYRRAAGGAPIPGIMHLELGGYHIGDIEFVAAFDVAAGKVGVDLSRAIFADPNNTERFARVPACGVEVRRGPTYDGIGRYLDLYNHRRPHSSLDGRTPDDAYFGHDSMPPIRLAA